MKHLSTLTRLAVTAFASAHMVAAYSDDWVNGKSDGGPKVCRQIQRALDTRSLTKADPFTLQSTPSRGGDTQYIGLDIDGDTVPDKVEQSCGSPSDGTCSLFVELSGGGRLEFEEEYFFVTRFKARYYVLVGESRSVPAKEKKNKRRMYSLTAQGVKLICPQI